MSMSLRRAHPIPQTESVASALAHFFSIYDSRLTTSCDFFIWRTRNQICLPVGDRQVEVALFFNISRKYRREWLEEEINNNNKLERDCDTEKFFRLRLADPRAFVDWCKHEHDTTLEWKKFVPGDIIRRQETFNEYLYLQTHSSKWIINYNNESTDVGRAFARTIIWDEIKMLELDHPIFSFIIDFTQPQSKFREAISPPIFDEITRIPELYHKTPSESFVKLFNKFYLDNKRWRYDDFGSVNSDDQCQPFYFFVRDICKHLFSIWELGVHKECCSEGTWGRLIMNPLLKLITDPSTLKEQGFGQWEGARSLIFKFREKADPKEPDFAVLLEIDNTIQEVFYENSSDLLVKDLKKFQTDLYKLFRLGYYSKQKIGFQLVNDNLRYLPNHESLYKKLCEVELFLVQAYETNIRISIMDQPAPPLCRVRELFDIPIPYKLPVDRISVLYFVHNLWKVHLGFMETVKEMITVNQVINRLRQGPTVQHMYDSQA